MTAWNEDRKFVLESLKTVKETQDDHGKTLGDIRESVAALKVKAGIWGLIGGMIPVAIALGYLTIRHLST